MQWRPRICKSFGAAPNTVAEFSLNQNANYDNFGISVTDGRVQLGYAILKRVNKRFPKDGKFKSKSSFDSSTAECYSCGKSGHIASECMSKSSGGPSPVSRVGEKVDYEAKYKKLLSAV